MNNKIMKLASIGTSAAVAALLATAATASAQSDGYGPMAHRVHHTRPAAHVRPVERVAHVEHYRPLGTPRVAADDDYRPLTVGGHAGYAPVTPGYNPYGGYGAVVTGPVAFGATLASLPFRFINALFPYDAHDPRVLVGAPVHLAGRIVQAPFAVAQAPFGGPGPFVEPTY